MIICSPLPDFMIALIPVPPLSVTKVMWSISVFKNLLFQFPVQFTTNRILGDDTLANTRENELIDKQGAEDQQGQADKKWKPHCTVTRNIQTIESDRDDNNADGNKENTRKEVNPSPGSIGMDKFHIRYLSI